MRSSVRLQFLLVILVFSVGCKLNTDYFGEYRDVNLLGNYRFGDVTAQGNPKWALATSTDFMTWEPAANVVAPDGTSEVYRLEIKNLIPNGDFEDAAVTAEGQTTLPPHWSVINNDGTEAFDKIVFGLDPSTTVHKGSINGRAMSWESGQSGDQLRLDLWGAALTSSPTAWVAGKYRFRCDIINTSDRAELAAYLYDTSANDQVTDGVLAEDGGIWTIRTQNELNEVNHTDVFSASRMFLIRDAASDFRTLVFGPNSAQGTYAAVIDNVRLLPDDQVLSVRAEFPRLASGSLPLLPGTKKGMYVFTVALRDDPQVGSGNHFHPKVFSIILEASVKSGDRQVSMTVPRPADGWSDWTTITFSLGFDFVNSNADIDADRPYALAIELRPTVFNNGEVDVGSVLVSQPSLTFNP